MSTAMMGSQTINQQLQMLAQQKRALILQQSYYKRRQEHVKSSLLLQRQSDCNDKTEMEVTSLQNSTLKPARRQDYLMALHQTGLLSQTIPLGLDLLEIQRKWLEQTCGGSMAKSKWLEQTCGGSTAKRKRSASTGTDPTSSTRAAIGQKHSPCDGRGQDADVHSLYGYGTCRWPACEVVCQDFEDFLKHLSGDHVLDDRSTAQCRVQKQVVEQLALQLSKEQQRLQAMMSHLHLQQSEPHTFPSEPHTFPSEPHTCEIHSNMKAATVQMSDGPNTEPRPFSPPLIPRTPSPTSPCTPIPNTGAPLGASTRPKRRLIRGHSRGHSRGPHTPLCAGDLPADYEFYKSADIRPPFTYAALIRQAIVEAPNMRLTLREIYQWFTRTFTFFRRNAATWKNAVRHNLSLHKCFVRVENVKGAVWTVDDEEYSKRRAQKMTSLGSRSGLNARGQRPLVDPSSLLMENPTLLGNSSPGLENSMLLDNTSPGLDNSTLHGNSSPGLKSQKIKTLDGPPKSDKTQSDMAIVSTHRQLAEHGETEHPAQMHSSHCVLHKEEQPSPEPQDAENAN